MINRGRAVSAVLAALSAAGLLHTTTTAAAQDGAVLVTMTPPAGGPVDALTWNLPYEPSSLDPTKAAYFAENQVLANLCEPLQLLQPDYSITDGLATASNPDPATWVYDISEAATFWDGTPVTAEDVKFSLERNFSADVPSAWSFYFRNVSAVDVTGPRQVTVRLSKPDMVFNSGLATAGGAIVQKAFAETAGDALGTSSGGLMCSGPFRLDAWTPGTDLTIVRHDGYWNAERAAEVERITFNWLADENLLTNALMSGAVDGSYQVPTSAIARLRSSPAGALYMGETLIQFMMIVKNLDDGALSDVRLRQALSLAIDREAIAQTAFNGAAVPARTLVTESNYGYGQDVFAAAWEGYGEPVVDLEAAQALVAEAAPDRPVVIGYPVGGAAYAEQVALAVADAGSEIGLEMELQGIPSAIYNAQMFDPSAFADVDLLLTPWFIDVPEPLVMYEQFLPSISIYNLGGYTNEAFDALVDQASETANPVERAALAVQVDAILREDLPWIPLVQTANTLFMNARISGAPASFVQDYYPWAADIGGN